MGQYGIVELDDLSERRHAERSRATGRALIKRPCVRPLGIDLRDISTEGCGFNSEAEIAQGTRLLLDLPGLEIWSATVIWWRSGRGGMRFSRPLHPAVAERYAA